MRLTRDRSSGQPHWSHLPWRFAMALLAFIAPALAAAQAWQLKGPVGAAPITTLAVSPTTSTTIYAGTGGSGVYKSVDGGGTWLAINAGLPSLAVNALLVDRVDPRVVYAGTAAGLAKTTADATWSVTSLGPRPTYALAGSSAALYAGTDIGGFKSTDGGSTWVPMTNGLPENRVRALATDPTGGPTVYAGSDTGLFKSSDAGASWVLANNGLALFFADAIVIDPNAPSTVYAATHFFGPTGSISDLPATGALFKSVDGGVTWSRANAGLTNSAGIVVPITSVAIDPLDSANVYVGSAGSGVFSSADGGAHWTPINRGLTDRGVNALVLTSGGSGAALYTGTTAGVFRASGSGAAEAFVGTVPAVIFAPGQHGAQFLSWLQISNPSDPCPPPCSLSNTIAGHLVFHPAGPFSSNDPSIEFAVAPGATADSFSDFFQPGLGCLDVFSGSAVEPVVLGEIANVGLGGNFGTSVRMIPADEVLRPRDVAVLLTPSTLARPTFQYRFNVGVRTFDLPVGLAVTVTRETGELVRTLTRSYTANFMQQVPVEDFLTAPDATPPGPYQLLPNDRIRVSVSGGRAVIYGASADNQTNDPTLQIPARLR